MTMLSTIHDIRICTITVPGRLDAVQAADLRVAIDDALENDIARFVVDLSQTEFVDSAGLAALANGMKHARRVGGDLRVVRATNPDAARVFSLTRFDQVFTMGDSAQSLVDSW